MKTGFVFFLAAKKRKGMPGAEFWVDTFDVLELDPEFFVQTNPRFDPNLRKAEEEKNKKATPPKKEEN